ncbi:hypothetical protein Cgig2_004117 [Carnegiea gigantea]|uniref:Uncharacterized protein n=1 Tax=Carnegiea gigantea TaxID=171969 RepID=A0A9Q1KTC9_9CARY|nr:hypothetical protein Cgig2_004117 [Carnegiea gigantea]
MVIKQKKLEYPKNQHAKRRNQQDHQQLLEIHKAVAQAWLSHLNNAKLATTTEFDLRKMRFQPKPSRFKLEASKKMKLEDEKKSANGKIWDFSQSLWDSYEIMAVSKRLESGLVLGYNGFDDNFHRVDDNRSLFKKRKQNKNHILKNLFNKMSPRRVSDVGFYGREDDEEEDDFSHCEGNTSNKYL